VILSTNKRGKEIPVLFSHGPNKAFLVPNSCRVTIRNGNSIKHGLHRAHCGKRL